MLTENSVAIDEKVLTPVSINMIGTPKNKVDIGVHEKSAIYWLMLYGKMVI